MTTGPSIPTRLLRHHRTTLAFLALAILVLLVRLLWGWWVSRQLTAQLDDARRRGHPVSLADLSFPHLRPGQTLTLLTTPQPPTTNPPLPQPQSGDMM